MGYVTSLGDTIVCLCGDTAELHRSGSARLGQSEWLTSSSHLWLAGRARVSHRKDFSQGTSGVHVTPGSQAPQPPVQVEKRFTSTEAGSASEVPAPLGSALQVPARRPGGGSGRSGHRQVGASSRSHLKMCRQGGSGRSGHSQSHCHHDRDCASGTASAASRGNFTLNIMTAVAAPPDSE